MPLNDGHRRNVIDPLSAFLMPVVGKGLANACNRTLQIFDGAARYDIKMSQSGTREVKLEGYSGPVAVCQVRYVPIAGHRSERPSTKFMIENRDISTWLAPVAGTNVMVPVRVSVKTMMQRLQSVIEHPRPYVRTKVYFGPCRRRRGAEVYQGPERREKKDKEAAA